ncbi:MAG: NUDIX hydrolase [Bacteroidetes bacterium]|nr:NUDIX hydrolase [Bacteroidota bacterium]MBU1115228.1 NUDIX hydrolase [Bacteroidota bacterium]MBU1797246.1 NUDIX hydrolase [Bacteroidota bacterium]
MIKNLSIDCVVFGFENNKLELLLIKRKSNPSKDSWALPGGFVLKTETLDEAAVRILEENSNVKNIYLEQVHTFSRIDRFPLRRVISVAYFALIDPENHFLKPGVDTTDVKWFQVNEKIEFPFDHAEIFQRALKRLRQRVRTKPIGFELLPEKFSLTQLQNLYECILDENMDKRNFRKRILSYNMLIPLDEYQEGVAHRAARLYKFDSKEYQNFIDKGFNFQL